MATTTLTEGTFEQFIDASRELDMGEVRTDVAATGARSA